MKLNHIALFSKDIEADRKMFETYFGLKTLVDRHSMIVIMQDDQGLIVMLNHLENKLNNFAYPTDFDIMHIGFIQESPEAVNGVHARLSADGWETQEPHHYHGAWSFYFRSKGGFVIEVATLTPVRPEEAYHPKPENESRS